MLILERNPTTILILEGDPTYSDPCENQGDHHLESHKQKQNQADSIRESDL